MKRGGEDAAKQRWGEGGVSKYVYIYGKERERDEKEKIGGIHNEMAFVWKAGRRLDFCVSHRAVTKTTNLGRKH